MEALGDMLDGSFRAGVSFMPSGVCVGTNVIPISFSLSYTFLLFFFMVF